METVDSSLLPRHWEKGRSVPWLQGPRVPPRAPAAVRGLALGIVPWTLALAALDPERWFPGRAAKRGWLAMDLGLAAGLFALSRRWRPGLAGVVATALTFDAALTFAQVVGFNLPRARRRSDLAGAAVGLAMPVIGAGVLWGARSAKR